LVQGRTASYLWHSKSSAFIACEYKSSFHSFDWLKRYPSLLGRGVEDDDYLPDDDEVPDGEWEEAIMDFTNDPYWTRAWILQETVLARELWVMAGMAIVPFDACEELLSFAHRLRRNL
jgi:hypothetical protein